MMNNNTVECCDFDWDQNIDTIVKKKHYKCNYYTLFYPTDKIKHKKFECSEQISAFLLTNAQEIGYCKWQLFEKTVIQKEDTVQIIYSCRKQYCDAILVYLQRKKDYIKSKQEKTENLQKIVQNGIPFQSKCYLYESKIVNRHRHLIPLSPTISSDMNIRQYLFDLPVQQKFQNHVQVIKQKFNLTKCQAKCLRDRIFWKFRDEDHMLKKLAQRKILFRRKMQNGKTTVIILASQTMKNNYVKYGDMFCFDVTYKLLKKKVTEPKHLGVGFFVGQDENARIVLFAVSTIEHETSQNFQILFQFFFQIVVTIPQTILTDDQKAVGIALQRLKRLKNYDYVHLLDWFHKMEAMRKRVRRQPYRDELFNLFSRMLKEPSKQVYLTLAIQIAGILEKKDIMFQFIKQQHRYCLSQVPQRFFAFGISSTRAQAFNGLIKRSVPHQTNFGRFIYFVLRVQKRLLNRMAVLNYMNKQLLRHITCQQIKILWQHLQHLSFQQIRQYYQQSRQLSPPVDTPSPIHKVVYYQKYDRTFKYNLVYDIRSACWRCQCRANLRTGMPCAHVMRVVRDYGGCVGYYVNQRWLHCKQNAVIRKAARPNIRNKKI